MFGQSVTGMSDRFFRKLLKWGSGVLLTIFVAGKLTIVIQNPPPLQLVYERIVFSVIMLLLTLAFVGVVIVLFVVETIRRVKRGR
jgi:hypothetical protein